MQRTLWIEIHLTSAALDNSLSSSCWLERGSLAIASAQAPVPVHTRTSSQKVQARQARQQGGGRPRRPPAVVASLGDRWGCQRRPGSLRRPVWAASGAKGSGRRSRRGGAPPGAERRPAARRPPALATARGCRSGLPGRTWRWAPCWRRGSRRPYTPARCAGGRSPSRRPASARTRSVRPGSGALSTQRAPGSPLAAGQRVAACSPLRQVARGRADHALPNSCGGTCQPKLPPWRPPLLPKAGHVCPPQATLLLPRAPLRHATGAKACGRVVRACACGSQCLQVSHMTLTLPYAGAESRTERPRAPGPGQLPEGGPPDGRRAARARRAARCRAHAAARSAPALGLPRARSRCGSSAGTCVTHGSSRLCCW